MKTLLTYPLLFILFLASCKKDKEVKNSVEYDLDGVHYSYTGTGIMQEDTFGNGKMKTFYIANTTIPVMGVGIAENITPSSSNCFAQTTYKSTFLNAGCSDSVPGSCYSFSVVYGDVVSGLLMSTDDSSGQLHVTTCNEQTQEISATFQCVLSDPNGSSSVRHLSNGKLTRVHYERQ